MTKFQFLIQHSEVFVNLLVALPLLTTLRVIYYSDLL